MDIAHLLAHPDELNQETLYDLRRIVGVYPTYHAARILFLQNLFLLHDTTFDQELRRAALLVPDRRVLCNITQFGGLQPLLDRTQQGEEETSTAASTTAPEPVAETSELTTETSETAPAAETVAVPASALDVPADTPVSPATTPRRPRKKYATEDTTLTLLNNFLGDTPAPLQRRRIKADPSTDYMAYLSQNDESSAENADFSGNTMASGDVLGTDNGQRMEQLIDGFITSYQNGIQLSENPSVPEDILIDPEETDATDYVYDTKETSEAEAPETALYTRVVAMVSEPSASTSATSATASAPSTPSAEPESTSTSSSAEAGLTETLANIYIKQQKYDRALEVMAKMQSSSTKGNPYLADQVRFLQKLAINSRHKR